MTLHRLLSPTADAIARLARPFASNPPGAAGAARLCPHAAALRSCRDARQGAASRLCDRNRAFQSERARMRGAPQLDAQTPQSQAPSQEAQDDEEARQGQAKLRDGRRAGARTGDLRRRHHSDASRRWFLRLRRRRRAGMHERIRPDPRAASRAAALPGREQRRRMERSELSGRQHAGADRRRQLPLRRRIRA
jgi:hypothetical protein